MVVDDGGRVPAQAQSPGETDAAPPPRAASSGGRAVREIIETLLLAALIFFLVRLVVLNFRVDGESMTPNLQNEEMLLVNVNSYRHFDLNGLTNWLPGEDSATPNEVWPFGGPKRGDIVVFNPTPDADQPYIKRIIGLPGERVTFQDGYVYINGQRLEEAYIPAGETRCRQRQECDVLVSPDHIFVLGDNRTNSTDSRYIGEVPIDLVIGKAWVSYWPLNLFGFVPHNDYPDLPATPADGVNRGQPGTAVSAGSPATGEARELRRRQRQSERAAEQSETMVPGGLTPAPGT